MAQYYTVRFTTQKLIKRYDSKGKLESETKLDTPVTITALPYATAMSYSGCDNFVMEPYVLDERRSGRATGIGNGTKPVDYAQAARTFEKEATRVAARSSGKSKIAEAAATGNLAAAINA